MYERLLNKAAQQGIDIYEKPMNRKIKGLYADKVIWINASLHTTKEKSCIIAEEIGHYYTTEGDILDQSDVRNRKQEKLARSWAYEYMIPLSKIVQAYHNGISGRHDLAQFMEVTEEFLQAALDRYKEKYGLYTSYEQYTIYFDPLGVIEPIE